MPFFKCIYCHGENEQCVYCLGNGVLELNPKKLDIDKFIADEGLTDDRAKAILEFYNALVSLYELSDRVKHD